MGRVCSTHEEACIQHFGRKSERKETTRKTNVGGRIILGQILRNMGTIERCGQDSSS
jgi:hypothetical protein